MNSPSIFRCCTLELLISIRSSFEEALIGHSETVSIHGDKQNNIRKDSSFVMGLPLDMEL